VSDCETSCSTIAPDAVLEFSPPYTGVPVPITNSISQPTALAVDALYNLFVSNATSVTEYAPPYTGAPVATLPVANASALLVSP
jgi:hypothetical protein